MEWIKQLWEQLTSLLHWWVTVQPWERGLKIWMGKDVKTLNPGLHFRVPYFHSVYIQSIRLRYINTAPQTLTFKAGETVTIATIVGYQISDIFKVFNSVREIESAISGKVADSVSKIIHEGNFNKVSPDDITSKVMLHSNNLDWGVEIKSVSVLTYSRVRTYRLLNEGHWLSNDHNLEKKVI